MMMMTMMMKMLMMIVVVAVVVMHWVLVVVILMVVVKMMTINCLTKVRLVCLWMVHLEFDLFRYMCIDMNKIGILCEVLGPS